MVFLQCQTQRVVYLKPVNVEISNLASLLESQGPNQNELNQNLRRWGPESEHFFKNSLGDCNVQPGLGTIALMSLSRFYAKNKLFISTQKALDILVPGSPSLDASAITPCFSNLIPQPHQCIVHSNYTKS